MPWTYSTALTAPKDQVRLLIGDTDPTDQQLMDEEIAYFVANEVTTYMAAARCASALYARYSRQADKAVGDLKISMSQIADKYRQLSADLIASKGRLYAVPTSGGITVADAETNASNTALRHNAIRRGMHDFTSNPVVPNTEPS